jgi:hypothetical protein
MEKREGKKERNKKISERKYLEPIPKHQTSITARD